MPPPEPPLLSYVPSALKLLDLGPGDRKAMIKANPELPRELLSVSSVWTWPRRRPIELSARRRRKAEPEAAPRVFLRPQVTTCR